MLDQGVKAPSGDWKREKVIWHPKVLNHSACSPPASGARQVMDPLTVAAAVISHHRALNASLFCTSKGGVRQMDAAVWALLSNSNSSSGRAASSSHSPSSPSLRPSSSSARWASRLPSPPAPQSAGASPVRATKARHYSPGHAARLQVQAVKISWRATIFS